MYNILLILTGGTIGSVTSDGIIDVADGGAGNADCNSADYIAGCSLTENYYNLRGVDSAGRTDAGRIKSDDVVFSIRRPYNILSENITPYHWNILCRTIYEELDRNTDYHSHTEDNRRRDCGYDGVIIAHGSDTLTYTSAMLSIVYRNCNIPILLTAAGHPLDNPDTNGNRNFAACVDYICGDNEAGVYTIYEDGQGHMNVYNASTICEADGYLDEYRDQTGQVMGTIENGRYIKNGRYTAPASYTDDNCNTILNDRIRDNIAAILEGRKCMSDNVLMLRSYPGLRYDNICLDRHKPACVLHGLYHSGTAPSDTSSENSLMVFIEYCKSRSVPVYIAPVKSSADAVYASYRQLKNAGAVPIYDVNYETAYAMLVICNTFVDTKIF